MKERKVLMRSAHHTIGLVFPLVMIIGFSVRSLSAQTCPPAATPDPTTGIVEGLVSDVGNGSSNGTIGFDGLGRFVAVWQRPDEDPFLGNHIHALRFNVAGQRICDPAPLAPRTGQKLPSLAMNAVGEGVIGWASTAAFPPELDQFGLVQVRFNFEDFTFTLLPPVDMDPQDFEPSVGIGGGAPTPPHAVAWTNSFEQPLEGLLYATDATLQPAIRECGTGGLVCFVGGNDDTIKAWAPAVDQRESDGVLVIAWAEAESPTVQGSPFNIRMQLYQANGTKIGDEVVVNAPSELGGPELPLSDQTSPAVIIDDNNDIVVTWVGAFLPGCGLDGALRIFARRFVWNQDLDTAPVPVGDPFVVDSDPNAVVTNASVANPTVALTTSSDPNLCGSFLIAWNARNDAADPSRQEVRGQYFGPAGQPIAGEFRVHLATSMTGNDNTRRLGRSASHTLDYGPDGQVAAVWTTFNSAPAPLDVHFTLLPNSYPQYLESTQGASQLCIKADVNADGTADVNDIEPFVALLLAQPGMASACVNVIESCRADTNCDTAVNGLDIQPFVDILLGGTPCSGVSPCATLLAGGGSGGESAQAQGEGASGFEVPQETEDESSADAAPQPVLQDCDADGVSDADEIAGGPGAPGDCNGDAYPDACNLALVIFTSYDCNDNGVPDECELADDDANANGFLDACEPGGGLPAAGETSTEALVQFYDWSIAQTWGPGAGLTGAEQFEAVIDKLEDLGLPIQNPWLVE